eukprot:scaffold77130_cov63-Phaeocystis_antarctica.AAC.3
MPTRSTFVSNSASSLSRSGDSGAAIGSEVTAEPRTRPPKEMGGNFAFTADEPQRAPSRLAISRESAVVRKALAHCSARDLNSQQALHTRPTSSFDHDSA